MKLLQGRAAHGVGSSGINLAELVNGQVQDRVLVLPGGSAGWFDAFRLIGQGPPASGETWRPLYVGPQSGVSSAIWTDWQSDRCLAGAGVLAAGWTGHGTRILNLVNGRQSQWGAVTLPDILPLDVDRETGSILALSTTEFTQLLVYECTNPYVNPDGSRATPNRIIPTTGVISARSCGGLVVWRGIDNRAHTVDVSDLQLQPGSQLDAVLIVVSGAVWIVYLDQDGALVAHPVTDPTRGHVDRRGTYTFDAEWQGGDVLRVAGSLNQGESAGSTWMADWSLSALEDITPPVIVPVPTPAPTIPRFRAYVAPFFPFPGDQTPGSAVIVANRIDVRLLHTTKPVICDLSSMEASLDPGPETPWNMRSLLGIFAAESSFALKVQAFAAAWKTRVFAYDDSGDTYPSVMLARLRPHDVPVLQWYLREHEPRGLAPARWEQITLNLLARWPGDIAVATMNYTQWNGRADVWSDDDVIAVSGAMYALVNLSPRIVLVAPFADRREGGASTRPRLRTLLQAVADAADPVLPTLQPIPSVRPRPTPPPVVPPTGHPPAPVPHSAPEGRSMQIGDVILFRPLGATTPPDSRSFIRATIAKHDHDDPTYVALKDGDGKVLHFGATDGLPDGVRDSSGADERVTIDGRLLISRRDTSGGVAAVFEAVKLASTTP